MELIFADRNQKDIGIISDYDFDLSFGEDENNFSFSMPLQAHCCRAGYFLYIDGTEYGGVVDTIKVDTTKQVVTYEGRTWHGILENSIIQPDKGFDYLTVDGDANEILDELITRLDLGDIFEVPTENVNNSRVISTSEVYIGAYQFNRYTDAYKGIRAMLQEYSGKLKITHKGSRVILEGVLLDDYTRNDLWDSSQVDFKIEKAFHPCNHLICLGSGNLADRKVIHLFTDENGGIQPYTLKEEPLEDADYILDERNKVMDGLNEVCKVYDYGNAQTEENYILVNTQPANWYKVFNEYYVQSENGYKEAEESERTQESYELLTSKPTGANAWETHYSDYYEKKNGEYISVEAVVSDAVMGHTRLTKKPDDWAKKYSNYYYYYSDGLVSEYRKVSGETRYKYKVQTLEPSNWNTNYTDYYKRDPKKTKAVYISVPQARKVPKWKKNTYYTKTSYSVAPNWDKTTKAGTKYFIQYVKVKASESAPNWAANKYYSWNSEVLTVKPGWATGTYYRKAFDNYADLTTGGIERLKEYWDAEKLNLNLSNNQEYDVGDFVGATESTTGLDVVKTISQKIVTINSGLITTKYKLGGK